MMEMRMPAALAIIVMLGTIMYLSHENVSCKEKGGFLARGLFFVECVEPKQ